MKRIIYLTFIPLAVFISSCGFNNKELSAPITTDLDVLNHLSDNTTGDLISNKLKNELGLNPNLAHIPEIELKLQDDKFKIFFDVNHSDGTGDASNSIEDHFYKNDPRLERTPNSLVGIKNAQKDTIKLLQFDGDKWGVLKNTGFDFITFSEFHTPTLDNFLLKFLEYFNKKKFNINKIDFKMSLSIHIKDSPFYKKIRNLKLKFYYYSHSKLSWIPLKMKWHNTSSIVLEEIVALSTNKIGPIEDNLHLYFTDVPEEFFKDNILAKREFLVAKIVDYEIIDEDGHNILTYKKLMDSVKKNTTQVIINTPDNTQSYWIANKANGQQIKNLLWTIYGDNFLINKEIISINHLESNLGNVVSLSNLQYERTKGQWFGFSKQLNTHFSDYYFEKGDKILLTYLNGIELNRQIKNRIAKRFDPISEINNLQIYDLGSAEAHSNISLLITPYNKAFKKNLSDDIDNLYLIINGVDYKITDLIKSNLVETDWKENPDITQLSQLKFRGYQDIYLSINDIGKIHELPQDEKEIYLQFKVDLKHHTTIGIGSVIHNFYN